SGHDGKHDKETGALFSDSRCRRQRRPRYGTFFLSTLLPITPPRIPPTAAPITPPLTLLRLVVAPMIAPAAAPIAASRWVCFTTCPPLLATVPPLEYTRPPLP